MEQKSVVFTVINDLTYDQRMHKICSTLAADGWDVLIAGRVLPQSEELWAKKYRQKRLTCFFHRGKLFYFEYNLRLFFFLLFNKANVISAVDADTLIPCLLVSKIRSRKLVFDAHEYFSEVPELINRPFSQKIWKWVEKTFIPKVKNKYTVSESLAEEFERVGYGHFEIVRNVPEEQAVGLVKPPDEKFILYQGALNKGRALEELILAMHQIKIKLRIAGEGDLSAELRQLVKAEGLTSKVEFLGRVSPVELKQLTRLAFIGYNLLHPQGKSYYFSLSNKFFDYLQAGVPSLNPPFPEYIRLISEYKVGVICEPAPELIAQQINHLLADETFYHNLQAECLRTRSLFTWQTEAKKLIALYGTLR